MDDQGTEKSGPPAKPRNKEPVTSIQYRRRRFLRAAAARVFDGLDHLRETGLFDDNGDAPLAIEVFDECTENTRNFVYWRAEAVQDKLLEVFSEVKELKNCPRR